jgi:hypothetical protein
MTAVRRQNLIAAVLSAVVLVLLVLFLGSSGQPVQSSYRENTSSFFTDESGTKAIYMVMREFLPSVGRWMKPLDLLPPPGQVNPTTLLVMGPSERLRQEEAQGLEEWVRQGGQLILAIQGPWMLEAPEGWTGRTDSFLARHGFSFSAEQTGEETAEYTDATGTLVLAGGALKRGQYAVRFSGGGTIKGGQKQLGSGRIIVIADRRAWSNDRLARSANAVWLVSTALSWGNGRLLIDEFHHGFQRTRGPISLMFSFFASFWGLAFVQLALAGVLLLWLMGRRFGPVMEAGPGRLRQPLRRIESLATLLAAAKAKEFALQAIHQHLLRRLWRLRFGASGGASHTAVEQAIAASALSESYLSVIRRQEGGGSLKERELLEAARQAGNIIQEHQSGR